MAENPNSASAMPSTLIARRILTDPKQLFTALLILGSISIAIGRAFSFLHVLLAIIVPLVCILGYAAVNIISRHANSSKGQTADNCYFLGFLYFLVSLSATLVYLQADRIDVGDVVRGFGTALITTIAGLATRIYLLQGGSNLSENKERAESELTQAVLRFKDQIVATTDLLSSSQRVTAESLQVIVMSTSKALSETVDGCKAALQDSVNHVRTNLLEIQIPSNIFTEQLKPGLEELRAEVVQLAALVQTQTNLTSRATTALAKSATAAEEGANGVNAVIANTNSLLIQQTEELTRNAAMRESVQKLSDSLQGLEKYSVELKINFDRLLEASKSGEIAKLLEMSVKTVAALTVDIGKLDNSANALQVTTTKLDSLNVNLATLDTNLKSITNQAVSSQKDVQGQLVDLSNSARGTLDALSKIAKELEQSSAQRVSLYGRFFGRQ